MAGGGDGDKRREEVEKGGRKGGEKMQEPPPPAAPGPPPWEIIRDRRVFGIDRDVPRPCTSGAEARRNAWNATFGG